MNAPTAERLREIREDTALGQHRKAHDRDDLLAALDHAAEQMSLIGMGCDDPACVHCPELRSIIAYITGETP